MLQIIGVGDQLFELDRKEQELYNQRRAIGQIADQKTKFAKEQPYYPDAPKEPISASGELIRQQQDILAKNGENQRKRQNLYSLEAESKNIEGEIESLMRKLNDLKNKQANINIDLETARKSALDLHDESTAELEENIANIEQINIQVRANLDKDKAETDAQDYTDQYNALTVKIDQVRQVKKSTYSRVLIYHCRDSV